MECGGAGFFRDFSTKGGMGRMAQVNVAEEIRSVEEWAKNAVQEARLEGVRIVAAARTEGDERVKGAKQAAARWFRERLAAKESEANDMAARMVEEGKERAKALAESLGSRGQVVGNWIAEEVMARYGRSARKEG